MAKNMRQYIFEGMEHMQSGLQPFVLRSLEGGLGKDWRQEAAAVFPAIQPATGEEQPLDTQKLLKVMDRFWNECFRGVLSRSHRSIVNELIDVRNKLAHDGKFTYDDAERALDSMRRLLEAVSAGDSADKVGKMRTDILRTKFAELVRNEERKKPQRVSSITDTVSGLLPWREVVEPHQDVATGDFQQAEFAADLAKVYNGSAPLEYSNPQEFFSRTYLTNGLSNLLIGAAKRLSGKGGDPVVELHTNFGGGKTHSMLALYHMAGDTAIQDLPGLDHLLSKHGLGVPGRIARAVLVGTSRGPSDSIRQQDGTAINTTWGELAWKLGGKEAFEMVADNDANGVAPGSQLLENVFRKCAPNLILIDEWVAYLRQIYKKDGLPSGSFDANLSFVQSLTEAVKASPQTLLVASLPASQIEVGGEGGTEALTRIRQTFSRVESSWRPASQEESYEIVRRRLFKDIPGDKCQHRDNTLKQFAKLYRDNPKYFPQGCADEDYRRKLEKAYPIHPDLFDHLYTAWGSLEKFQRTRGVLRLMAQVIHELWRSNDRSALLMPGNVHVNSARIEPELLHYLEESWKSIIAKDIDGAEATPSKIDKDIPNLGCYCAATRVARAIFMGTAPLHSQENKGLNDRQINLGIVQPGEKIVIFGDALRRLANQATFMHSEHGRYWYSISQSLNRVAADRASQLDDDLILVEIDKALASYINGIKDRGHFETVHIAPNSSAEVPDESGGVRAVVLGVAHSHTGRNDSDAMVKSNDILLNRGTSPRIYRNIPVFLAADAKKLVDLKQATRASLAWIRIVRDSGDASRLDLKASDIAYANDKKKEATETMQIRIKETWCHLIYPYQKSATSEVGWETHRISAQDSILAQASKKLVSVEALLPEVGPVRLNHDLQEHIWKKEEHILLKDLWEYLNRHTYFPRLKNRETLVSAVRSAVGNLMPGPFAYAELWNEKTKTYEGLIINGSSNASVVIDGKSVLVRSDVAESQRAKDTAKSEKRGDTVAPDEQNQPPENSGSESSGQTGGGEESGGKDGGEKSEGEDGGEKEETLKHFVGTVMVSEERPMRDMKQIVEGIVEQLTTLPDSNVSLKLEIDAEVASGLDRATVRTLLENARTLGFIDKKID